MNTNFIVVRILQTSAFCLILLNGLLSGDTIKLRTLALSQNKSNVEIYTKTEAGYEQLAFSSRRPGSVVDALLEKGHINLYTPEISEAKEPAYKVVSCLPIPEQAQSALLLAWTEAEGYRYFVVEDKFEQPGYNHWLIINMTTIPVQLRIGKKEESLVIQAKQSKEHMINAPTNTGTPVLAKAEFNDVEKTFYSTYWQIREGERSIVLFVEKGSRIQVKRLGDSLDRK